MKMQNEKYKIKSAKWVAVAALLVAMGVIGVVAQKTQVETLANYFPGGALVYIETPNLRDLVIRWNNSETKANWYKTKNYEQFTNSRLYQKLQERLQEFGAAGSFPLDTEKLEGLAGTHSALAIYDIGELKALLITEISEAEATATELWAVRSSFVEKRWNDRSYFKEPEDGNLVFAYMEPHLLIATEEALLQRSLDAFHGKTSTVPLLVETEKWKQCQALNPDRHNVWMFLDQESLNANRYFRRYWIHQNSKSLKHILAAWIDLEIRKQKIEERRYFLTAERHEKISPDQLMAYLAPFESVHREFLSLDAAPEASDLANEVAEFVHRYPEQHQKTSYPPLYTAAFEKAAQAEQKNLYLVRIDQPILESAAEKAIVADQPEKIAELLGNANPVAVLRFAHPLWDDKALFVQFPKTMAIQVSNFKALDQAKLLDALHTYTLLLYSNLGEGNSWRKDGSDFVLDGIPSLYVRFQDPWLVISNRQPEFHSVTSKLPANPAVPSGSFSSINWENGRWKYSRLMRRLDTGMEASEPLFFSENVDSLLQALIAVKRSSIQRSPEKEIVTYELE